MFHLSPLFPYAEDVVDDIGLDIWEASRVLCNFMLQNIAVRHLITAAPASWSSEQVRSPLCHSFSPFGGTALSLCRNLESL